MKIKGRIRQTIYKNDNGFFVGLFRIKEADSEMQEFVSKTITISGSILDANEEEIYILNGDYVKHERFGYQFKIDTYEKEKITGKNAIIEFLASPLIKGCGEKTAKKIVDALGEKAIDLIKEDKNNLFKVNNMTNSRADKIYASILAHSNLDDAIIELKNYGFTIGEATRILKKYHEKTITFLHENLYYFKKIIDFNKLDYIYIKNFSNDTPLRKKECILASMQRMSDINGDIYYYQEEILSSLKSYFNIFLESEEFTNLILELASEQRVIIKDNNYYLQENYKMEYDIADNLRKINNLPSKELNNFDESLSSLEKRLNVSYNKEQKEAIKNALTNRITIISGGPGTGKTTIINAITRLYIEMNSLSPLETLSFISLLAPTGRASKKLAESTSIPAMTIHRYLKWNKDTNEFSVNEYNKNNHKLIIVDETSMIDTYLFDALLKGINYNIQLVLVGDNNQLPSVGAGLILNDLVESNLFSYNPLERIYRQSENSYIANLAHEIKERNISENFTERKDDYNFFVTESRNITKMIKEICKKCIDKGITTNMIQVLAPMYKGENGIDNLNMALQELFNPESENKKEIKYGDTIYREKDKVLQLVNNPDCNVYNGDIGYIVSIDKNNKKDAITINFDGSYVIYSKEELSMIKHAYAITIHKSQGSEFPHVILPISKNYYKMLYNKLIYTGVSRAKKSLIIVGEKNAFLMAINNDYSNNRKTSLKEVLLKNL